MFEPSDVADAEYYLQLFKTQAAGSVFRIESRGLGTGSSGFMRLYTDRFGTIKVPVPSLDQQRLIVHAIREKTATFNRAIDQIEREVNLLNEYHIRLIADVVSGKLDVRGAAESLPDETRPTETVEEFGDPLKSDEDSVEIEGETTPEEAEA